MCATTSATDRGLIGDRPTAAIDGTGLESRHTSRYFFQRSGKKHTSRLWTKLTVACDTKSHFFAGATVATGPSNDSPQLRPARLKKYREVCRLSNPVPSTAAVGASAIRPRPRADVVARRSRTT